MTARHTSAEAYHGIQPQAHSDRALIAELVRRRGPMTRREIASVLHMETPREHYARQERREALVDLALALLFVVGMVGVLVWLA